MNLRAYLNSLPMAERAEFAHRCGTTIGYLKKQLTIGGNFGAEIAIAIERESGGVVRVESLTPKPDWAYIRASGTAVASAQ